MSQEIYLLLLSAVITLLSNYALKYVSPRSRIIYWQSHYSDFLLQQLPQQSTQQSPQQVTERIPDMPVISTSTIIQNVGTKASNNIEIALLTPTLAFYKLYPPLPYTAEQLPTGEHIIKITRLAPSESFSFNTLGMHAPNLLYVRSENGIARKIFAQPQPIRNRAFILTVQILLLVGIFSASYWIIRTIIFLSHSI